MGETQAYRYDMSVIVPVYNAESYLSRCIASLDAQTASQESFEVVLINDGSTDDSLALCREFAEKRSNYVVLDQENGGVSSARNAGIAIANGRYIMFLDPDDEISAPSVASLVAEFDRLGDQVDLLTYPLLYHEVEQDYDYRHKRQKWFTESGVYDLGNYPYLAQTTINVCIRNEGEATATFDESLALGEDQRFITELLSRRAVIGYCSDAEYFYWHFKSGTAASSYLSIETFEGLVKNYERYLELAESDTAFAPYAHGLIVYDTSWRYRQGKLLPRDVSDDDLATCQNRLDAVLARVPQSSWLGSPYLSDTLRMYLMQRFGIVEAAKVSHSAEGTRVTLTDGQTLTLSAPEIVIDVVLRNSDRTIIKGGITGPALALGARSKLQIEVGGTMHDVDLEMVDGTRVGPDASVPRVARFKLEFPSLDDGGVKATFNLEIDDEDVSSFDLHFATVRCNGRIINPLVCALGNRCLVVMGATLMSAPFNGFLEAAANGLSVAGMNVMMLAKRNFERKRSITADLHKVEDLRKRLPKAVEEARAKHIWLYDDGTNGPGLALAQLRKDTRANPNVTRYYVGENKMPRGSFEHLVAMLAADVVLTTERDLINIQPCKRAVWDRVSDFAGEQRYVLLDSVGSMGDLIGFDELIVIPE